MEFLINNKEQNVTMEEMEFGKIYEYCPLSDHDSEVKQGELVMKVHNSTDYFISLNQLDRARNYWRGTGHVFKPRPDIKSITLIMKE